MDNSTAPTSAGTNVTEAAVTGSSSTLPTRSETTVTQVITTAAPATSDFVVIAVVISLILLTVAVMAFLLYRYYCHKKGQYRTTGELAPGEDPDEDFRNQAMSEKKEYFI